MNQIEQTKTMIDYIEQHLYEKHLNLAYLADVFGYSQYHLHRMFSGVTHLPIYTYIKRRRLNEAAKKLVATECSIIELALEAGYETQRSFSKAFKMIYKKSPNAYRKARSYFPMQLPYDDVKEYAGIQKTLDIRMEKHDEIQLIGYEASTAKGFFVIGKCWRNLHKQKRKIEHRCDLDYLIAVNDYSSFERNEEQPSFTYFAGAEVSKVEHIPDNMEYKKLPASDYVIFKFQGKNQDSVQPMIEYVYQYWFCESSCIFNENNPYDLVKYGEKINKDGTSFIELWVPIK